MKAGIVKNGSGRMMAGIGLLMAALTVAACDRRETVYVEPRDTTPPAVPTGVRTTTMDEAVLVEWNPVIQSDLAGYFVYRGNDNVRFFHLATVDAEVTEYLDVEVTNGTTYYYAVSSFDAEDNESELSLEDAFDTPRPEGFDVRIYDLGDPSFWHLSGFDFSEESRLPWDSPQCDFFLEFDDTPGINTYFLWVADSRSLIQDMGYTDSFDDITFAPNDGWSVFDYVEAIPGHTYVLWLVDNHYAKIRVHDFAGSPPYNILVDWGYQVDAGNRELSLPPTTVQTAVEVQ